MHKRRGVCITIFFQTFCLTQPKKFVGQHICVSEKFWYRKMLWIREEGDVSRFFFKIFVSQYRQKNAGQHFCVSEKFWCRKMLWIREEGVVARFFCQSFCLTVPKTSEGEPFCVSEKNRMSKMFTHKKGISIFCANNFLSQRVQKLRRWTRLSFKNFGYRKFLWIREEAGVSRFSVKVCVSQYQKKRELYHDFLSNFLSHST